MMQVETLAKATLVHAVWPRPAAFLSDAHGNSRGPHNNCQKGLLKEFLDDLRPGHWTIFIAGDWRDWAEERSGPAMMSENDDIERRLALFEVIEIAGNHEILRGVGEDAYVFDTGDLRVLHGHQLDPACSGAGRLDIVGSAVWSTTERLRLAPLFEGLRYKAVAWAERRRPTASVRGEGNARYLAHAEEKGRVLTVMGHTHDPDLIEWAPGYVYANPGSWVVKDRGNAILLDGRDVRLVEVRP